MGLMIKLFCCLLLIGVVGLFVLKSPDGTPWLSLSDFTPDTGSLELTIDDLTPEITSQTRDEVPMYRWRDARGNWQFSDQPPEGIEAELVTIDTTVNRNLLPPPPQTFETLSTPSNNSRAILIGDKESSPDEEVVTDIPTLINNAQDVQGLLDNRQELLDSAIKRSE